MEINYLDIFLGLFSLVLSSVAVKAYRIYPLLEKIYKLIKDKEDAKKDGKLSVVEKAVLYDDINSLAKEAWSLMIGLLPNKSKIN